MTTSSYDFQGDSLLQQGYDETPERLRELSWALRFTPSVCMVFALVGLLTQRAEIHFALAALGMIPFWFPSTHPVDLFYNKVLRPLWKGVRLPPNPLQRRIACFAGGAMNLAIGFSFAAGINLLAYAFGGLLVTLQLIVISTHFCMASFMWELGLRLIGRWQPPMEVAEARKMVSAGAMLVDVRSPEEFHGDHLPEAVNVPLEQVEEKLSGREQEALVLYCRSGFRSRAARSQLMRAGFTEVHDLGGIHRWSQQG